MARRIEDKFEPEELPYAISVWSFLTENGNFGGWQLSLELMTPVYDLVLQNQQNIVQYEQVTDEDTLVLQYIKLILPLLKRLNATDRANFAMGFLESVVEWNTED